MAFIRTVPFLVVVAGAASAEPPLKEMQRARCAVKDQQLSIVLRSASGEPAEDDMSAWIEHGATKLKVPFPASGWLELEPGKLNQVSGPVACADTLSLAHPDGRLLVLLSLDARPQAKELAGFVYDTTSRRVVDTFWQKYPHVPPLAAERWKDALLIASRPGLDSPFGGCPGSCPLVKGVKVSGVKDAELTTWWRLSMSGGFRATIIPDKTFVESGLGAELGTLQAFERAAEIDAGRARIGRTYVVRVELEDGRKCFALLPNQRRPEDAEWTCRR